MKNTGGDYDGIFVNILKDASQVTADKFFIYKHKFLN